MHYVHKKARCGPEIATFRTKTLHFFRVICLNWLTTIELRGGPGTLVFNSVVSYCCKRKTLKETETEETIGVFGEISIGGRGPAPCPPPLGYAMLQVRKAKVFENFTRGFWLFPTKFQLFKK